MIIPRLSRRRPRLAYIILIGLFLIPIACFLYGRYIESRWIQVTEISISLKQLPNSFNGFTIVQLSDIHFPDFLPLSYYRHVVNVTNNLHPDLIVLTGDYVPSSLANAKPFARLFGQLRAPYGVVAVLGNHDYWMGAPTISQAMVDQGMTLLCNRAILLARRRQRIWLVGADDYGSGRPDLQRALRGVPVNETKILLVHEPDFADQAVKFTIDLQLSGHSHGGQVRIPLVGWQHNPKYATRYPQGYYRVGHLQLYTNRGVGEIVPVRFNCRPEITCFTLHRQ